ncbi:Glycoside hydrolase, superfamily [Penicillium italicum]|uniref:Glycoside hydrolase, superfamily n=1 Tax=Penicillium italicum TaxID=40296 RepID=A0A0A2KPJ0_PENIT|nr:Glycoside hydrolase, superfamily [Penicillium italicum]
MRALLLFDSLGFAAAKNGLIGWLRYASLPCLGQYHSNLPSAIVTLHTTETSPVAFDPLDASDIEWWSKITTQAYDRIPDMAGYLVKAGSEGQPGSKAYNMTLADAASLFAKEVKPYGGIVMCRTFVYNQLNESIWTDDRAKAAVEFFRDLDGEFDDNVVIQIKYGPIDFQVREPASALFANLFNTSMALSRHHWTKWPCYQRVL